MFFLRVLGAESRWPQESSRRIQSNQHGKKTRFCEAVRPNKIVFSFCAVQFSIIVMGPANRWSGVPRGRPTTIFHAIAATIFHGLNGRGGEKLPAGKLCSKKGVFTELLSKTGVSIYYSVWVGVK